MRGARRAAGLLGCAAPALAAAAALQPGACDLERLEGSSVSAAQLEGRPVVLTGLTSNWPASSKWASAADFLALHGDAAGFARDHDQLELRDVDVTVREYLSPGRLGGDRPAANLSASAAFFVNDLEDDRLLRRLEGDYWVPGPLNETQALRVFALERGGAGVAFHRHEAAWQAMVVGRKAWFFAPPSVEAVPQHSPCAFVGDGPPPDALRCVVGPGEIVHVPGGWWHATCTFSDEATVAIGAVGSVRSWSPALVAARSGDAGSIGAHLAASGADPDDPQVPPGGGVLMGGERPLHLAAAFGHAGAVDALLALRASPNVRRRDGRTAVHEAARRGDVGILQRLHAAGGDLGAVDAAGNTPLHHSCAERGDAAAVGYLLASGARGDARRDDGRTPLHVACRGHVGPVPLLRALLESGAPPSPKDRLGMTPLMHCAAAGHARGVGLLLRFGGREAARAADAAGRDALSHAVAGRGDAGAVSRLLAAGLPVGERLLPLAARLGHVELLPLLAGAGAAPGGAVLEAARAGHAAAVAALLAGLGGTVDEREPESGATPLHHAALAGHAGAVRALLAAGASAAALDEDGLSPLHYAATAAGRVREGRRREIVELLVGSGGSSLWRQRGQGGVLPMHLVAASGDAFLARWLLQDGLVPEPHAPDDAGGTPAALAEQGNHSELAALLREWEAAAPPVRERQEEL